MMQLNGLLTLKRLALWEESSLCGPAGELLLRHLLVGLAVFLKAAV